MPAVLILISWRRWPACKAAAGVGFETEIDLHAFGARRERLRMDGGEVGGAEIAAQLVVEVHGGLVGLFGRCGKAAKNRIM